ncbi:fungal-specific transcription factor domain-containing protein [Penicillium concentricum]|uniref:Fungal-specific transcription factor domain-containing protein n=1 Tax=Penicillium concentricum TaxID=293559 RepID=A0A9W9SCR6_9EURO|nr:fungal-specific transcription factor domain-containing protein [Penicillium concentricum]KAJ5375737.1 fungal-specific transcription factor domain-containing protein [Penicillium concentricum]
MAHLLTSTEIEQESMARITVESLQCQSANAALEQLDREDHTLAASPLQIFSRGPFGVLNISSDNSQSIGNVESNPSPAITTSPRQVMPWQNIMVSQLEDAPPGIWTPESCTPSPHDYGLAPSPNRSSTSEIATMVYSKNNREKNISTLDSLNTGPFSITSLTTATPREVYAMPERAPQLIRYFKYQVRSLSYPLKGNKRCPWQTIHLPRAEKAYAELLLHQTASNTGISLFYSLLAGSCFHLSSKEDHSLDYEKDGNEYKQLSRHYLEQSIKQEIASEEKVKYKELLMALLSTVMLEIRCGNYTDAQNLLVESECLIRKRGLPKAHKSLKVRILHHVYTYIRIMAESTCGCALMDICPMRPSARLASNEVTFSSLRSFRVADDSTISDLNATLEKAFHVGTNDIHLEILGVWKESLFQEIYGLPESLVGLLSQTIRLANEQELLHRDTTINIDLVLTLNKRTKTLEYQVLSWRADLELSGSREDLPPTNPQYMKVKAEICLSSAVHQGLILFYYRRMHNMNALILQDTVRKVLGFIRKSENYCTSKDHMEASLLWPAFIAACEALEPELQTGLLDWISSTGARTSIPAFTAAANVVQRVWKLRQEGMDYTISWFNVMDHDRCPIIAV